MKKNSIERYLSKHAHPMMAHDQLLPPKPCLRLIIVIPCLAEIEHIAMTLDSLILGNQRLQEAEVIVVVNHSQDAEPSIVNNNLRTLKLLHNRPAGPLDIHIIDRASAGASFEPKQAGVGLARRIGMDIALSRLNQAGAPLQSAIACLDADATVAPGYLDQLLSIFTVENQPAAGICHFEHPLPDDPKLKEAIIYYELWLRYLEWGLKLSGSPFAYQSMGSSMVVSAQSYAQADGMPCRQAAEDFHFLQKVAKISRTKGIIKITQTAVYPAARLSDRVLFGTGKAMKKAKENGDHAYRKVVNPQHFFELKEFFSSFSLGLKDLHIINQAGSININQFMVHEGGWPIIKRLQKNYNHPNQFEVACHHWFDGLKIIRFLNQYGHNNKQDVVLALPKMMEVAEHQGSWQVDNMNSKNEIEKATLWLSLLRQHWKDL